MLPRTLCTTRIARIYTNRIQWRRTPLRCYSSANSDDPQWFQQLRTELMQRDVTHIAEHVTQPHEDKLSQTLTGFLPQTWCRPPRFHYRVMPFGHHLIWFNPAVPTFELLPDGTDASQSPGGPWVRRMWAGGSIQLRPDDYFDDSRGCTMDTAMVGTEHIKDVRLYGEGDTAKIFVTIERRFARTDRVAKAYRAKHGEIIQGTQSGNRKLQTDLEQQLRAWDDDGWGHAILKEERNLVFFKERTAAELEAVKAGQMATVKYLDAPGSPDFSHTLTPNRALLFRFSALTFNAHLIHLDPDYARNVEGHRNLLVHGPLSLILMLKTINHHVHTETKGRQALQSIEYRNLAPLYCDEEMRICCSKKKKSKNGNVYDVWIEGPTGGVAVKGTVHTTAKPITDKLAAVTPTARAKAAAIAAPVVSTNEPNPERHWFRRPEHKELRDKLAQNLIRARKIQASSKDGTQDHTASGEKQLSRDLPALPLGSEPTTSPETTPSSEPTTNPETSESFELPTSSEPSSQSQGEILHQSTPSETASQPPSREVTRAYRRDHATNTKAYNFITLPLSAPPPARLVDSLKPVRPTLSIRSKELLRRARRRVSAAAVIQIDPIPLVRRYDAKPYTPDPVRTAARHSRFLREGVRKMEKVKIRHVAELSERMAGRWSMDIRGTKK
ncbi:hypothetical protein G6011_01046 [Alternaria panax]|uniref:Mesaconyl-C4 CoA hydratase n=1 Tax=Alternaria panax TaxID=48097 RepID=A0AAD4NW73_9PLEO|nr:hypothetical protein G6011_01046 [Alternaria panax]